ncbi:MAG: ribonuclease [Lachnospiraceae bacterium]|nr:ribonuclease [Lachnospiraceae bacterium]
MKKRRFPVLLIFLSVLTLLFTGCDIDSFAYINPDGSTIEYNTHSGTVTINEPEEVSIPDEEEIADDEDNEDPKPAEDIEDEEIEETSEESDIENSEVLDDEDTAFEVTEETVEEDAGLTVSEDGEYTSKEEVALYIHLYNHLPSNYITKSEAQDLGWDSSKGNLNKVAPGKSIGGDKFGNREGLLPKKEGRVYYECDIDYKKGSRNAKRIVFSNDGLIYYTEDHYESYELLYE